MAGNGFHLSERKVTKQIRDYLEWRGWTYHRLQSVGFRNKANRYVPIGERGIADSQFLYYLKPSPYALVLWVELKSENDRRVCAAWCRNRKLRSTKLCTVCAQKEWQEQERKRGALVVQTDSYEAFLIWYEQRFGTARIPRNMEELVMQIA